MIIYNPVYTVEEVCIMLNLTENLLWDFMKHGKLKYIIVEETLLIRGKDLEDFINGFTGL